MPQRTRVQTAFLRARRLAARTFPCLRTVRISPCAEADRDHRRTWRLFFHSGHRRQAVCFARAAETELGEDELLGLLLHELGHLVADRGRFPHHARQRPGRSTPDSVQMEADVTVAVALGLRTYGYNARELERVDPAEFARAERRR